MAIRNLTNWNDPLFRKISKPVTNFDDRLWALLDDMRETLEKVKGYGCAAVHVRVLRRVVVVLDKDGVIELVNPSIIETSEKMERVLEGSIAPCAAIHVRVLRRVIVVLDKYGVIELINPSITETSEKMERVLEGSIAPDAPRGYVERPDKVTVSAFDRHGEPIKITGEGFLAATLLHEIDHLDGILFTDKAHPGKAGERSEDRPASFAKQNERATEILR